MPRRLLHMNYLPSRDLWRESLLTTYVDLDDGWYKKVKAAYEERTDEENCMGRSNA